MEVRIDRDNCIGCGMCIKLCPAVFRMGDDGASEVYAAPRADSEGAVAEAADSCPVGVIHVTA